jgi:hypothetical protein
MHLGVRVALPQLLVLVVLVTLLTQLCNHRYPCNSPDPSSVILGVHVVLSTQAAVVLGVFGVPVTISTPALHSAALGVPKCPLKPCSVL